MLSIASLKPLNIDSSLKTNQSNLQNSDHASLEFFLCVWETAQIKLIVASMSFIFIYYIVVYSMSTLCLTSYVR